MKFTIEQSSDNNEVEINIKCGQIIDEKLQKLIDQIRLYSFSIVCKKDKEIYQISLAFMIVISILNGMGISDLNWIFNLELFVVTTLISLFMYIIDKLNIESQPVYMFLQIISVAISVLGIGGGIMKWFRWTLEYVSITTGVFVVVYFITYGVVFFINSITTEKINQKIAEHNNKEN